MNISPEQYYWYIRRPQMLRKLFADGSANDSQYEQFEKSLRKITDYFYTGQFSKYDWSAMDGRTPIPDAGCTAVRRGNYLGRNYDYYYDKTPEFLISCLASDNRCSSIAITQYPGITDSEISSKTENYKDSVKRLPFIVVDGINECGLVVEQNMLPVGDNPYHQSLMNTYVNDEWKLHDYWNRTMHTKIGKTRRSASFLPKTVLDNCGNVSAAVSCITQDYDWCSFFGHSKTPNYYLDGLELHWMISDPNESIVVEFVNPNETLSSTNVSEIFVHWYKMLSNNEAFGKYKVSRYVSGQKVGEAICVDGTESSIIRTGDVGFENNRLGFDYPGTPVYPIMTNFYITGWNGDGSGFNRYPIDNSTLTRYAIGMHRHLVMTKLYSEPGYENMLKYMKLAEYHNAYKISGDIFHTGDFDTIWYSEFSDPIGRVLDKYGEIMPELSNGIHMGMTTYDIYEHSEIMCMQYLSAWNNGTRLSASDPDCPWITVNRSAYDITSKTLSVVVQQEALSASTDISVRTFAL